MGSIFLVHSLVFPAGPLVSILPKKKNKMSKSQSLDQNRGLTTTPDLAFPPIKVKLY